MVVEMGRAKVSIGKHNYYAGRSKPRTEGRARARDSAGANARGRSTKVRVEMKPSLKTKTLSEFLLVCGEAVTILYTALNGNLIYQP